jgi:hypothetical protein
MGFSVTAGSSIHKHKFVQIQDDPAGALQTVSPGMIGQRLLFRPARYAAEGKPVGGGGGLLGRATRSTRAARRLARVNMNPLL